MWASKTLVEITADLATWHVKNHKRLSVKDGRKFVNIIRDLQNINLELIKKAK